MKEMLSRAAAYCASAERCRQDVMEKLLKWDCPEDDATEIIDFLYRENYLSDERYCRAFANDKLNFQGWGKKKIQAMLQLKHLPRNIISATLQDIDEQHYRQRLSDILKAKKKTTPDMQKLIRFALSRGFDYEDIKSVLLDSHSFHTSSSIDAPMFGDGVE